MIKLKDLLTEASMSSDSKKFLKGMKKIPLKAFAKMYMPGQKYVWYDSNSKKFYYLDSDGDYMELRNENTLKELHKFLKTQNITLESVNEAVDKSKLKKIYDKLNKGDDVTIKYGSSVRSGNSGDFIVKKGKTTVGKAKVERITLVNKANPSGVKYYLYNRNGNISLAIGDMAATIDDIQMNESVNESKGTYFRAAYEAAEYARSMAEKKGYEIDEEDWQSQIGFGGKYNRLRPGIGKTHSFTVGLTKNGKPQRKGLSISLYGMESGNYELTTYIN
jgi:hypothetical protein